MARPCRGFWRFFMVLACVLTCSGQHRVGQGADFFRCLVDCTGIERGLGVVLDSQLQRLCHRRRGGAHELTELTR